MSSKRDQINERLRSLPEPLLSEVLAFLTQLESRYQRSSGSKGAETDQSDPLMSIAGSLSGDPVSSQEIDLELYGQQLK